MKWSDGYDNYEATATAATDFARESLCWNHSIVAELDYKSPWKAQMQGFLMQQTLLRIDFDDAEQCFQIDTPVHHGYEDAKAEYQVETSQ